jgi:LysM repeat protein
LIGVNPQITNTDEISVGDKIVIPRQENGDIATYTVKQGDTIYKIAQKYNVPVEALLNANRDIISADLIYPNQKLQIPGPHLVQKGQTLFGIANLYGTTQEKLKRANPQITDGDMIRMQTMVVIPPAERNSCRRGDNDVDYTVQQGDTIYQIARMYDISANDIIRANPEIRNADYVEPGMMLTIPVSGSNPVEYSSAKREIESSRPARYPEIYVVRRGDTLYSIAARYQTTVKQLRQANASLKDSDTVYPGQQIIVLPSDMTSEYRCLNCPWLEQGMEE